MARLDKLENKPKPPEKHYLETVGLSDDDVWLWCLNNETDAILRNGKKAYYRRIGVKSVKVNIVKRTNHAAKFSKADLRTERNLVKRIIVIRDTYGEFTL